MDGRKAFFMFGLWILIWTVFWNGMLRTIAVKRPDSNWAKGLLHDV